MSDSPKSYVRMLEFGLPKTGKTRNTCSTFPGPVLLFNFDPDGYSSIIREVVVIKSAPFRANLSLPDGKWNENIVYVLDYTGRAESIGPLVTKPMTAAPVIEFIKDVNVLAKNCPFSTVVVDPVTMWDSFMNDFVGGMNSVQQLQIQHWGQAAKKKEEIINFINSLPCHTVFLAHEDTERDEITGQIRVIPLITGQMKNKIGMMFSQFVYAATEKKNDGTTRFVVWTQPDKLVKGIGMRFPQDLPPVVDNNFNALFGGKL